jgi:hypothetical protein
MQGSACDETCSPPHSPPERGSLRSPYMPGMGTAPGLAASESHLRPQSPACLSVASAELSGYDAPRDPPCEFSSWTTVRASGTP